MTLVEIRDAIMTRINSSLATINSGWSSTDVAWPNRDFDPTGKSSYLRPTVRMGDTFLGEKGQNGIGIRFGVLYLDIFVSNNDGVRSGLGYGDGAETVFRRKDVEGIYTGEPSTAEVGPDPSTVFYHIQTMVPFHTWVGE